MMRIVHWAKYYPPEMGGIEVVTREIVVAHAAMGHQAQVVCFTADASRTESVEGVLVQRCSQAWMAASQPLGWSYLRAGLRLGREADVVHLHAPNLLAGWMAARLGPGPRLVVHWHSDIVGKGLLGRLVKPIERAMLRRADAIICTSPPYARHSESLAPWGEKVHCIPIGLPDPGLSVAPLAEPFRAFKADRKLIFSAGRLVPYKGFRFLLEAMRLLPPEVALILAGEGPLKADLQSLASDLGVADRVLFAGRVSDRDMDSLFRHADLFCLPSIERSEAFGVVLVEAMSRGVPAVTTRIPGSGVPWVNEHGVSGLNVEPGQAPGLAAACAEILSDAGLRSRLAAGARARYLSHFRDQASAEAVLALYGQAP